MLKKVKLLMVKLNKKYLDNFFHKLKEKKKMHTKVSKTEYVQPYK